MAKTPKKNTAKNAAAQAMSVLRNNKLTPKRRKEIARQAGIKGAAKRWGKKPQSVETDSESLTLLRAAQDVVTQISALIEQKDADTKLAAYVRENAEDVVYSLIYASLWGETPDAKQTFRSEAHEIAARTGLDVAEQSDRAQSDYAKDAL
jgi:hypothetical protein